MRRVPATQPPQQAMPVAWLLPHKCGSVRSPASFGLSWLPALQAINCHALTYYVMHE